MSFAQLARTLTGPPADFNTYVSRIDPAVGSLVKQCRQRLQRRRFELELYYVTTGRCSAPLKTEAEAVVAQANGIATLSVLDRSNVLSLLTDYLGGAAPPVPFLDLPIDPRGIVGSDGAIERFDPKTKIASWILSMSGGELGALYARAGDRLFARNIRGFLGEKGINEGIAESIKHRPDSFWYFNNGVTLVCDSARKSAERGIAVLRVTNPQIINGQQTTRMLSANRIKAKNAAVLVRVISVPREGSEGQEDFEHLVSNIVAATNYQNAILTSDLRANDARQVVMEREFAKLRYHYLRKRQSKKEARRIFGSQHQFWIKKEELAQVVGACELDPVVVRSGKEGLFKQPYYDQIFDGRLVRDYLSIYWVGRTVKYAGSGYPNRAYAKWHAMHFLWKGVEQFLRSKATANSFREECERNRRPVTVVRATNHLFEGLLAFFRAKRGKGNQAIDISNFFYRPHIHTEFEAYWRRSGGKHRIGFDKQIKKFGATLRVATQS
jgi:hypothetical protein